LKSKGVRNGKKKIVFCASDKYLRYAFGMDYFYGVMNGCKGGSVAAPFLDGVVGAGVAGEMIYHLNAGKAVWLIEAPNPCRI